MRLHVRSGGNELESDSASVPDLKAAAVHRVIVEPCPAENLRSGDLRQTIDLSAPWVKLWLLRLALIALLLSSLPSPGQTLDLPSSATAGNDNGTGLPRQVAEQVTQSVPALDKVIERDIAGGEHHSYRIELAAGTYARVLLDPHDIDLAVALFGGDGAELITLESAYGAQEPISLSVVATQPSTYRLDVHATEGDAPSGHYKLWVSDIRAATVQDADAAQAQKLFAQGQRLHKEGTAESREAALEVFGQARSLWQKAGDRQGEAQALDQLGGLENELGDNQKAGDFLQESLQLFRAVGDRLGEALVLNDLGCVSNDLGDNTKALSYFNEALSARKALGDRRGEAETLENIGTVYESLSEGQKALESYDAALSIRRTIHDRQGEGQSLDEIGVVYYDLDEYRKALEYYNQALPLRRATHDLWGEAATFNNMGVAYDTLGEKQHAIEYFDKSLPLKRATGNRRGEATTLNNMCWLEFTLDEWQSAIEHCNGALQLQRAVGDRKGQAMTLSHLGSIYDTLGDQQTALKFLNEALSEARTAGTRMWEGIILGNIGQVYFDVRDNGSALAYYEQALSVRRAVGDRDGEAGALNNIGRIEDASGDKENALKHFSEALQVARDVDSRRWGAATLSNMGWLYSRQGETQRALDCFNRALPIHRDLGDRRAEALTIYGIARAERTLGNLGDALTQIEAALQIVESLRTKVISQQLRASYFSSVQEYYEFYIGLLMQMNQLHPSQGYDARALAANERSRARSLLESLGETRAEIREGVDQRLLERERSLQQLIDGKTESRMRLLAGKETQQQATAMKAEIGQLLMEYESVEAEIPQKSPRYAALTQAQPLALERIQQLVVDPETLLLEYGLGEQHSYLWAVTPTTLDAYELPSRVDIEETAKRVYDFAETHKQRTNGEREGTEAEYSEAVANLSRMVLGPVSSLLRGKRLLIVADGALQYVPFGILRDPNSGSGGRKQMQPVPLITEHEVVNLPSASTLAALRVQVKDRTPAPKAVAVLADPVFDEDDPRVVKSSKVVPSRSQVREGSAGVNESTLEALANARLTRSAQELGFTRGARFPRLVFSRKEAASVLAGVPAEQRMEVLDFEANRSIAMNHDMSQYRIVHFATHGLLDSQHPELSGLVLSLVNKEGKPENGFLQLKDIYNLKLSADLVVLSACQTALGKEVKGEGLLGLTRGFMYAGAPRVVASLWNVDDAATAELMGQFYKNMLQEGVRPAAALRQAQVEMWKQKRWTDPHYWAAFVLQGDWN